MVPCKNWPSCPIMFAVHLSSFVYRRVSRIKMANNNVWVSKYGKESEREREREGKGEGMCFDKIKGMVQKLEVVLCYGFQALASGQWTELLSFWTSIFWYTKHFLKVLEALLLKSCKYAYWIWLILLLAKNCGLSIYSVYRCLSNSWLISFAITVYFTFRDIYIYTTCIFAGPNVTKLIGGNGGSLCLPCLCMLLVYSQVGRTFFT